MKPVNRKEMFLDAMAKGDFSGIEPVSREEMFMWKIGQNGGGNSGGAGVPKLFLTWNEDEYIDVQKKEGGATFDEIATAIENGIYPEVIMIYNGERHLKCVEIGYYDRDNYLCFDFCITSNVPMRSFAIYMKPDSSIFID